MLIKYDFIFYYKIKALLKNWGVKGVFSLNENKLEIKRRLFINKKVRRKKIFIKIF